MAAVIIQQHYITSGLPGGGLYMTGQYIRVIGDGAIVRAQLWTAQAPGGSLIGTPSGGPKLSGDGITVSSGSFNDPRSCEGDDMRYYTVQDAWPYAKSNLSLNHPSCAIFECDIKITSAIPTNETTIGAFNGSIALTATSHGGVVKFSLTPDFDYADGQDSPITGLSNGNYIVFAKDPAGCVDQINVYVGVDYIYGVRWRLDYDKFAPVGWKSRIDILQRDYTGPIEMTCGGATPFKLEYSPEDKSQVISSTAICEFFVERNEEGKFTEIREGDDRKHILKKYLDKGDGAGLVLEWAGYISPEFYEEPYIFEPYPITLQALDGLKELDNKLFIQDSGEPFFGSMSLIQIITECLKKLPIELPLRSCINIYEQDMTHDVDDDPLAQTFIDVRNYDGDTCAEVLSKVIHPFNESQLFQSMGIWWIRTNEQAADSSLNYREFDRDGEYVDNGNIETRKTLGFPRHATRMMFIEVNQTLRYSRPYGKVGIRHMLNKDNNMIDSGGFEVRDIDLATEFFRGWHVFPLQSNVSSGLEFVINGDSKGAFFFEWNSADAQKLNKLVSDAMPISVDIDEGTGNIGWNQATSFTLKFALYVAPIVNAPWIWFGWTLRFTDVDTGTFWDWDKQSGGPLSLTPSPNVEHINNEYITNYFEWKQFEYKNFRFPGPATAIHFTIQVIFYFHNHKHRDYQTFDQLRAVPTDASKQGDKVYLGIDVDPYRHQTLAYELQYSMSDEHEPEVIRPTTFVPASIGNVGNAYQWILTSTIGYDRDAPFLDKLLIDNVGIAMYAVRPFLDRPGVYLIEPPTEALYEATITDRNESSLVEEVFNADAPPIVGAEYIYNGFFKLANGLKTKRWTRLSVPDEREHLLTLYLLYLQSQGAKSKRLLSGDGIADIQIGFIHSLVDVIDDRVYRIKRLSIDDKEGKYAFELEDTFITADGESPIPLGEFSDDFSDDFNV